MERTLDVVLTSNPIGIFDSGVGGLSVWTEIRSQLPNESTIYFADQAHVPYGSRPISEVRQFATGITDFLRNQGVKLIVVACNTASGAALQHLRTTYPGINFVGMEPAVKPAVENTHTGHIGVLATPATFEGFLYQGLVHRFGHNVKIHTQTCPGLVEIIENGQTSGTSVHTLLESCLHPLLRQNIDQLVLGCTHYPFILNIVMRIIGDKITIINPAPAVARQAGRLLKRNSLLSPEKHQIKHVFYTSGSVSNFHNLAKELVAYNGQILRAEWQDDVLSTSI
jgi:glutamate racemase